MVMVKCLPIISPQQRVDLTPCQLTCARLAAMGLMQKEIGHELGITIKTVNRHIEQVNRKLGTHNPLEVARALILLDLLSIDDFLQPNIEEWREARRVDY
jgi:DNA-binding NarL/FixJ family response regulator